MKRVTRRSRRRSSNLMLDISMTPLIDVALTLLVIFIVATPMMQNAIRVSLPKGKAKEDAGSRQDIVVYVDKDKKIFFNGNEVKPDQLVDALKKKIGDQKDKMVYVKADQVVSYGSVLELVDHIKVVGGISHVVLATQKYA
jgi:biopolymer transport protein TolR